ncbi:MAG: MFS transporter, partial [Chloroflexi bacterium]|nr:MFS transporter [Chloroflexota bacterium]
ARGALIVPLEAEFQWSRAAIAGAVALGLLLFGLAAPFAGKLIDRFGPRIVATVSVALFALGTLLTLTVSSVLELVLYWGVVIGLGTGGTALVLGATIANRWFVSHRGLVTGVLSSAASAGQLVAVPLVVLLTVAYDWRTGVIVVAGFSFVLVPLVWLFLQDSPASVGLRGYGAETQTAAQAAAATASPVPMSRVVRHGDFWLLAGSFFVCGATSTGLIGTHLLPFAQDQGISSTAAAWAFGIMGAVNALGTMGSGWLCDRFDRRRLLFAYYTFRGLSLLARPWVSGPISLFLLAIIFGLEYIATVPPTATLVADVFGKQSVGQVFGWIFAAHQLGSAVVSSLAGVFYVWTGTYFESFVGAGLLAIVAGAFCLRLRVQTVSPVPVPA